MTELFVIATAGVAIAVLRVSIWEMQRYRSRTWLHVDGVVQAAYYRVIGKNVYPLVDISYDLEGARNDLRGVRAGDIDLGSFIAGSKIRLLVDPNRQDRCIVDR